jgi:hypothetical protein
MPEKLLKPKPMLVVEQCALCAHQHVEPHAYRRCSVCGQVFCWTGEPRSESVFGVESRECGARREHAAESDAKPRIEYRCRRCVTHSWVLFGADWAVMRPLAIYVFLCVAFSVAFWGLLFALVGHWLRSMGIG